MRMPKLHAEVDERGPYTAYGGLALFTRLAKHIRVAETIDAHVHVLKAHLPYHESDHVLAQAASLYVGGTCIDDMMFIQKDEAVLRMFGACRTPDPTTGASPGSSACVASVRSPSWISTVISRSCAGCSSRELTSHTTASGRSMS